MLKRQSPSTRNLVRKVKSRKYQECKYTLEELQRLALQVTDPYLTSQINIYNADCNRFNTKIDELFKSL